MRHCCNFNPDDIYYLEDNTLYTNRRLLIGVCPICKKPVAELSGTDLTGNRSKKVLSGIKADRMVQNIKDEIIYSLRDYNFAKFKSKPFGWKYGVNKLAKRNGQEIIKQYAQDFYGNTELIKSLP